jgi:hypothetical protein
VKLGSLAPTLMAKSTLHCLMWLSVIPNSSLKEKMPQKSLMRFIGIGSEMTLLPSKRSIFGLVAIFNHSHGERTMKQSHIDIVDIHINKAHSELNEAKKLLAPGNTNYALDMAKIWLRNAQQTLKNIPIS